MELKNFTIVIFLVTFLALPRSFAGEIANAFQKVECSATAQSSEVSPRSARRDLRFFKLMDQRHIEWLQPIVVSMQSAIAASDKAAVQAQADLETLRGADGGEKFIQLLGSEITALESLPAQNAELEKKLLAAKQSLETSSGLHPLQIKLRELALESAQKDLAAIGESKNILPAIKEWLAGGARATAPRELQSWLFVYRLDLRARMSRQERLVSAALVQQVQDLISSKRARIKAIGEHLEQSAAQAPGEADLDLLRGQEEKFTSDRFYSLSLEKPLETIAPADLPCGLSAAEYVSVRDYSMLGYLPLNKALNSGHMDAEGINEYIELLALALNKLKAYQGPVTRGAGLPAGLVASYKVGDELVFRAFTSTTTNSFTSKRFTRNIFYKIQSSSGRNIAPLSALSGEDEILFTAGTKFRIQKIEKDGDVTVLYLVE